MFRSLYLKESAALATLSLALSVLLAADKAELPKPSLVSKGKDYFIHAVPSAREPEPTEFHASVLPGGLQLLHTLSQTGEMRILLTTGIRVTVGPERARFFHYSQTRIVAVAGDAERLYVMTWTSGDSRNPPASTKEPIKGGSYRLLVFWLADGANLAELELTGKGLPETAPKETTDKGPLEIGDKEVTCYGLKISVHGKEIAKPIPKN